MIVECTWLMAGCILASPNQSSVFLEEKLEMPMDLTSPISTVFSMAFHVSCSCNR